MNNSNQTSNVWAGLEQDIAEVKAIAAKYNVRNVRGKFAKVCNRPGVIKLRPAVKPNPADIDHLLTFSDCLGR